MLGNITPNNGAFLRRFRHECSSVGELRKYAEWEHGSEPCNHLHPEERTIFPSACHFHPPRQIKPAIRHIDRYESYSRITKGEREGDKGWKGSWRRRRSDQRPFNASNTGRLNVT